MRSPQQLSDSLMVTQETYAKAGDFCPPMLELLPQDCASHQRLRLIMQGTAGDLLHHHHHSLQHLLADLHNQQKQGRFPSRPSLGAHNNNDMQDLGGLAASIHRHTTVEKNHRNARHQACVRCGSRSTLELGKLINKQAKPLRAAEQLRSL